MSASTEHVLTSVERAVVRVLTFGTWIAVALLLIGVALMAINGLDPTSAVFPPFDPATIPADLLALKPGGFLWAGLLVIIATPIVRVAGELIGFASAREWDMTVIAAGVLLVVALSVTLATLLET